MDLFRKKDIRVAIESHEHLKKCLTALDLTFLGIGAVIGAGIFVLTGVVAATHAGPGIVFSYILAGLACVFSALCYAELSASIGGCGGAYGYAYAGFGEIIAWIVGWDLLLEYAIAVSAVSVGWSSYVNDLFHAVGINLSQYFTHSIIEGGIFNSLAVGIIAVLSILLIVGVKSSARFNNIMVMVKLSVILLFIIIASLEIEPSNWNPFLPFGWEGVIKGASLIFFAYVGFDAVATTAEEAQNPQKDLPIGIIGSLLICTFIYIVVSGLLTGIVNYKDLNVASPISNALLRLGYNFASGLIGVGAIAGLTTVMLVLFFGLTRVFWAMARDGLLPRFFVPLTKHTKSPARIIILCGIVIGTSSALLPITELAELVNIGTLFAFTLVCAGVIILRYQRPDLHRPFKVPFMPIIPILGILVCIYLIIHLPWVTLMRFIIWMTLGMILYFTYGKKHSELELIKNRQ